MNAAAPALHSCRAPSLARCVSSRPLRALPLPASPPSRFLSGPVGTCACYPDFKRTMSCSGVRLCKDKLSDLGHWLSFPEPHLLLL